MRTVKNKSVEDKLHAFLKEYASFDDGYWFPLTTLKKAIPVIAYDLDELYRHGEISLLEKVFRQCGITTVSTFQMDSREYFENDEISALLHEKDADGFNFPWTVETFYFDDTETWLVYVSHEGTISFTGEPIARTVGEIIPDRYLYR